MRRLVLALIVLVLATSGCRSDDPVVESSAPSTSAPDLLQIQVEVRGGVASGGVTSKAVEVGRAVRLTVTSDVADSLVVTGTPAQDGTYPLTAGAPFIRDAVASKPGVIEATLDRQRLPIATLTVT